ncbi:TetR/AcrR family transcriptional regulator [Curtobacterium sp. MWU13-2055]|uniref:TetR/AcrR family transcriptional regulator n=1 Tax=Curtobacterium sp. MWU13-2055 TaxID=2931928 RepID=UPI00200E1A9C|nr:TetR/AcrR family transcriptional regulator [Curtobacterium sp. MWU13-2055]
MTKELPVRTPPIDSAWTTAPLARPDRSTTLSLSAIVAKAVDILDTESTPHGLTMRRLAAELGVTAAAMYWHVRTRDELLDHALDAVFGEVRIPDTNLPWDQAVVQLMVDWRRAMLKHPWSPPLAGRPLQGPLVTLRIEALQAALVRGGFQDLALAAATRLFADITVGSALTESAARQADGASLRRAAATMMETHPELYPTLLHSGHLHQEQPDSTLLFARIMQQLTTSITPASSPPEMNREPH